MGGTFLRGQGFSKTGSWSLGGAGRGRWYRYAIAPTRSSAGWLSRQDISETNVTILKEKGCYICQRVNITVTLDEKYMGLNATVVSWPYLQGDEISQCDISIIFLYPFLEACVKPVRFFSRNVTGTKCPVGEKLGGRRAMVEMSLERSVWADALSRHCVSFKRPGLLQMDRQNRKPSCITVSLGLHGIWLLAYFAQNTAADTLETCLLAASLMDVN